MYIKFKEEGDYHFCEEHMREIGKMGEGRTLENPDEVVEQTVGPPPDDEICNECQKLKRQGKCTLHYIKKTFE